MNRPRLIFLSFVVLAIASAIVLINYSGPASEFEQPRSADLFAENVESVNATNTVNCELTEKKNCPETDFVHRKAVVRENESKRVEQVNISVKRSDLSTGAPNPERQEPGSRGYEFYVERLALAEDSTTALGINFQYDVVMGRLTKILTHPTKAPQKDDKLSQLSRGEEPQAS